MMSKETQEYLKQFEGRKDVEELRSFFEQYIGQGEEKKDIVTQEDVDNILVFLVDSELQKGVAEDIKNYGKSHPEAPFWDFLKFLRPGLEGITQEELMEDDE